MKIQHFLAFFTFSAMSVTLPIYCHPGHDHETDQTDSHKIQTEYTKNAEVPGALLFTPPEGWYVSDPKILPKRVKVMVIGKGLSEYPPSINLGMEPYKNTVKDYLKTVKAINEAQGSEWKDLGNIQTQAGNASLSQVDLKTEWGDVRLMHVILQKSGMLYVITAAALKDEFPVYYKDFFTAFRSIRFNKEALEMIVSAKRRNDLEKQIQLVKDEWYTFYLKQKQQNNQLTSEEIFVKDPFKADKWLAFTAMIEKDYSDMSPTWRSHLIDKTHDEMIEYAARPKKLNPEVTNNQ